MVRVYPLLVAFYLLIFYKSCAAKTTEFPKNFLFGASTAAYQVEGGWNADGKGASIWDTFTHNHPDLIADKSNGDVGPNSYEFFDKDLAAIKDLGLDFYRFSISWTRILPSGDVSSLNKAGLNYYNNIINKLIENGIEPMVTMFHYDSPEELQKFGGFSNPLIIKYFTAYADVLFTNFGDRVKFWITVNELAVHCINGYGNGIRAPQIYAPGIGEYLCMDHTLKAHASVYRLYRQKFYKKFKGKVGISLDSMYFYSKFNNTAITDRAMEFYFGWSANPIFSATGDYPQIMIDEIYKNSMKEGRKWSRLPYMTEYWKDLVKGSGDFLGLNYYSSRYVEMANDSTQEVHPSIDGDSKIVTLADPSWKRAKSDWLYSVPQGLADILRWIKRKYNNVEVFITENGWSDDGELEDKDRIDYIKEHLHAVQQAIEDGCNVLGYTAWSLIDNFEWLMGYTEKFGLYYVNLTSPHKERIAKKSAGFYKKLIETKKIPY